MDAAQALAIAAAAFVMSQLMDRPAFPQHITARTEAAIETAIENAVWRAQVQPTLMQDAYASPAWSACETEQKAVRL